MNFYIHGNPIMEFALSRTPQPNQRAEIEIEGHPEKPLSGMNGLLLKRKSSLPSIEI